MSENALFLILYFDPRIPYKNLIVRVWVCQVPWLPNFYKVKKGETAQNFWFVLCYLYPLMKTSSCDKWRWNNKDFFFFYRAVHLKGSTSSKQQQGVEQILGVMQKHFERVILFALFCLLEDASSPRQCCCISFASQRMSGLSFLCVYYRLASNSPVYAYLCIREVHIQRWVFSSGWGEGCQLCFSCSCTSLGWVRREGLRSKCPELCGHGWKSWALWAVSLWSGVMMGITKIQAQDGTCSWVPTLPPPCLAGTGRSGSLPAH